MQILLVHHADAVDPAVDAQRPLSARGRAQALQMAAEARAKGCVPAAIWHSGKLRARQTAEPFLSLNPFAAVTMVRGLSPDDPPELMCERLRAEDRDLILVGHMPNMPALAQMLTGGLDAFPLHGMVALETQDRGLTWTTCWRAAPTRASQS